MRASRGSPPRRENGGRAARKGVEDARRAKGLGRWKGKGRRRSKQLLFILSDTLRKREREKVQIARVVEFSLPLAAISRIRIQCSSNPPILSFDRALQEITTNFSTSTRFVRNFFLEGKIQRKRLVFEGGGEEDSNDSVSKQFRVGRVKLTTLL